jgi:hypothetical protein
MMTLAYPNAQAMHEYQTYRQAAADLDPDVVYDVEIKLDAAAAVIASGTTPGVALAIALSDLHERDFALHESLREGCSFAQMLTLCAEGAQTIAKDPKGGPFEARLADGAQLLLGRRDTRQERTSG